MNHALRTTLAVAVLTTLAPSQRTDERLARLVLIEQQEGDLRTAEAGYRELLADADATALHADAALRLGTLLWRLERRADATPFLQRAAQASGAIGDAATKVLQGQGDSDKAAQERLVHARAVVARLDDLLQTERASASTRSPADSENLVKVIASTERELSFLGDAAATALAEQLRTARRALPADGGGVEKDGVLLRLAGNLWCIGTEPARSYFSEVATDPMVAWRRAMVARSFGAAADMLPLAETFLRDGDPTGDVPNAMDALAHLVPIAHLTRFVSDGNAKVRAFGWTGLGKVWHKLAEPEQVAALDNVGDRFVAAVSTDELRVRAAAEPFGRMLSAQGPASGRRLLLRLLGKGIDIGNITAGAAERFQLDDDAVAELAAAGRALGPCPPLVKGAGDGGGPAAIATILALHDAQWKEAGAASIVELVELGYARAQVEARWAKRFVNHATAAQAAAVVRTLPHVPVPRPILEAMTAVSSPELYPAARDAFEAALRGADGGWRLSATGSGRRSEEPTSEAWLLSALVGKSRATAAAAWLVEIAQRSPVHTNAAASALVLLSVDTGQEPVRAAMRTLLVATDAAGKALTPPMRGLLFLELVRLGDVPSIPLLPRALALGVDEVFHPVCTARQTPQSPGPKLHALAGFGEIGGATWHHYDAPHLNEAWLSLFAGAPTETLDFLVSHNRGVPIGALAALVRLLPNVVDPDHENRWRRVSAAAGELRAARVGDVGVDSDLRRAIVETIAGPDVQTAIAVIDGLQDDVLRVVADDVRARVRSIAEPSEVLARLLRCGVSLSVDEWRLTLRGAAWQSALAMPPAKPDPGLMAEVTALLSSTDTQRRVAACATLACWMAEEGVAPLLEALRDPVKEVRDAAADALQRIRFHREQTSFWTHASNSVDTSAAGAVTKLVVQAQADAPRDQRVLAIRSLGVLGAPEALPHLIEWTKDADTEVAAAARAAIELIHGKAAPRK